MIVTIDGPAASGKSTTARNLARKLNIAYLDTGATYRAVTLKALRDGIDLTDETALTQAARDMKIDMVADPEGVIVLLNGQDVTEDIRSSWVTGNVKYAAASPATRKVLVQLQRDLGEELGDFVAEGRDQGTVVFPNADFKFYLVAEPKVRAARRMAEGIERGETRTLPEVLAEILARDERDASRTVSPMVKPSGAIEVDTTSKDPEQVALELLTHIGTAR